ncbi:MAG: hypothetical protein IJD11_03955, partial [Oscillospiraceae bacterium]|nr:hypothetical protein [Oscillospiraceae bacterium]
MFSLLCTIVLLAGSIPVCTAAEETQASTNTPILNKTLSYHAYQQQIKDQTEAGATIQIKADSFEVGNKAAVKDTYEGKTGVLLLDDQAGSFTYRFSVEKEGMYRIKADYFPIVTNGVLDINLSFQLDGKTPFEEAKNIFLSKVYANEVEEFEKDKSGNDLRPSQIEKPEWRTTSFIDNAGYNSEPFAVYLTKGEHQITIAVDQEKVALEQLTFDGEYKLPTYAEVKKEYDAKGYKPAKGELITYRAEMADKKSSMSTYPARDGSNAALDPSDPKILKLNIISDGDPGEWISWTVKPTETGLYSFALRVSQNANRGMNNSRRLYINGEVPFEEANIIEFPYKTQWYNYVIGGEEDPYLFYMEAGKEYEITLESTTGRFADTLQVVQEAVLDLNTISRKITMVTGMSPDLYRDYDFDAQIPDLNDQLIDIKKRLEDEMERLGTLMETTGSELATIDDTIRQLNQFIENPRSIPSGLSNFRTNISSLGTWMLNRTKQTLRYDSFYLVPEGADLGTAQANIFVQFWYECQAVFYSFFSDYEISEADSSITVWATAGRDQVNIIRRMIDDEFSPKYNTDVTLSLVADSATLLQATLANTGPD